MHSLMSSSIVCREGENIPYFLVPQTFSRFDTPLQKLFRRELLPENNDNNLIGKSARETILTQHTNNEFFDFDFR